MPGRFFGLPNHFRIGMGVDSEMFREGLQRIGQALQDRLKEDTLIWCPGTESNRHALSSLGILSSGHHLWFSPIGVGFQVVAIVGPFFPFLACLFPLVGHDSDMIQDQEAEPGRSGYHRPAACLPALSFDITGRRKRGQTFCGVVLSGEKFGYTPSPHIRRRSCFVLDLPTGRSRVLRGVWIYNPDHPILYQTGNSFRFNNCNGLWLLSASRH